MSEPNGSPQGRRAKIVVVGAGFGGMSAVRALRGCAADVTLIDRTNHHLFQPLLYQVATAALSPADIATASRVILRGQDNVTILMANVRGVDAVRRRLLLDGARELEYDYLILATGSDYSFFGHHEWARHALVLKTVDDALAIRSRLLGAFEQAEQCDDAREVARLLTFVVVGAGPTGVEMAGTIAELARATLARDFRHIDPRLSRVVLCEAGERVLASFPQRLSVYAKAALEHLHIDVRLGQPVTEIDARGLILGSTRIETYNVIWCAGTEARPAARWLGALAARNGAVKVSADCSVPGMSEVFAIGDVANYVDNAGNALPGLAAVAEQQGRYVGRMLKARLSGKAPIAPFSYRDLGTMAVIGRSRAIANLGRLRLTGFLAWLAWSLVHLMLLVDYRSRIIVYVNWSWAWFTYGRGARLLTGLPAQTPADELADRDSV